MSHHHLSVSSGALVDTADSVRHCICLYECFFIIIIYFLFHPAWAESQKTLVLYDFKTLVLFNNNCCHSAQLDIGKLIRSCHNSAFVLVHLCTTCVIFFVWKALSRLEAAFVYCPTSKVAVFFFFSFVCLQPNMCIKSTLFILSSHWVIPLDAVDASSSLSRQMCVNRPKHNMRCINIWARGVWVHGSD